MASFPSLSIDIPLNNGIVLTVLRPSNESVEKLSSKAKEIFVEAFSTTYTSYHKVAGLSDKKIEEWLRLKDGLTLKSWLESTYDDEYQDFLKSERVFVFLQDANKDLVGWMTHSHVSEDGSLYLSQCSLKKEWRNQKVATQIFASLLSSSFLKDFFPNMTTAKLITRRINAAAIRLYESAGFKRDDKIDPKVYGDSYDDRYVGFRLTFA